MSAAVIIPVRGFRGAKARLADVFDEAERASLARVLLATVIGAADPRPVLVVTADPEVADAARAAGATPVRDPGEGLDGAARAGVAAAAALGHELAVIAHGDLPFAAGLADLGNLPGVTLVPDRRADGTNVIAVPVSAGFRFQYGPGSFHRHLAEVERLGLASTVLADTPLSWDVDLPEDLDTPADWGRPPWVHADA